MKLLRNFFAAPWVMLILFAAMPSVASAAQVETCEGVDQFVQLLESKSVPGPSHTQALEDCLVRTNNRNIWFSYSQRLGDALGTFLLATFSEPTNGLGNTLLAEKNSRLRFASDFLTKSKDLYETKRQQSSFHEIAVRIKGKLSQEGAIGPEFKRVIDSIYSIPEDSRRNNNVRISSLDQLTKALQEELKIINIKIQDDGIQDDGIQDDGIQDNGIDPPDKPPKKSPGSQASTTPPKEPGENEEPPHLAFLFGFLIGIIVTVLAYEARSRVLAARKERWSPPPPESDSPTIQQYQQLDISLRELSQKHSTLSGLVLRQDDPSIARKDQLTALRTALEIATRAEIVKVDDQLSRRLDEVQQQSRMLGSGLQRLNTTVSRLESHGSVQGKQLERKIAALAAQETSENKPDWIDLEKLALADLWGKAQGHLKGSLFLDILSGENPHWDSRIQQICTDLPAQMPAGPLKDAVAAVILPVKSAHLLVSKLQAIRKILEGSHPKGAPELENDAKTLFKIRDFAFHLFALVNTDEGQRRLEFRLEGWVRKDFRGFADEFYREFWKRQFEGHAEGFESAKELVDETLHLGNLQVVELVPGQTQFDTSEFIGRSTAAYPDIPEGAIVGVIRVGFKDLETDRVLQHPEVVVNRP